MTLTSVQFFQALLAFQTDASDVHAAMSTAAPGFVLIDSRSDASWEQGHVAGAVHLPTAQIAARAGSLVPPGTPVVTYCWGPGCNGGTKAALEFAKLGYEVREMIGGYEYWVREGLPIETSNGVKALEPDPLTTPVAAACGC